MTINTKEKGITLIALIVTIIVLLILAGVTIISLTGENGILGKSSDAKLKREIAKEIEQIKLSVNAVYTSYYDKGYLPVVPLRKELQTSYEGVTSVEETSDIGEATKVSKAKRKVDFGSIFWTESLAAENEDVEPTQEFAKVTYTSKREYYVKIKNVTGGNADPVGTIYANGGTTKDDVSGNSITYNLNGGVNPDDAPTSYKEGEVIGFPTPTKDGSAFEGWYQTSDFSDERVLRTNDTMSGSITLYAKWVEETNPDYFTWTDGSTTSTVTGFSEEGLAVYNAGNLTKLVIPKKHNNLEVTAIKNLAFWERDKLIGVVIPDTVTDTGYSAFKNCKLIEEITVPISLNLAKVDIYETIFAGCTNIKKVNFTKGTGMGVDYSGVDDITPWYISRDNDLEITMEEGITKIGSCAFDGCARLQTLELPTTLTSVGPEAFYGCKNWNTKIDMSKWTSIGRSAFNGCSNITGEFKLSDELLELEDYVFEECSKLTGEVKIPSKVTNVGSSTFDSCSGINKVTIPDTVTDIGYNAFKNCTGMEELTAPISLNLVKGDLSYTIFVGCTNIKKVNFTKGTGEGANYENKSDRTPWYLSKDNELEITMEEGITKIGNSTFNCCFGIRKLNLPTTLTSIGSSAFYECVNWETKIDMSKWTDIGASAFTDCSKITGEFNLSPNMTQLGRYAFEGCSKLTGEVIIPSNITKPEASIFEGCVGINKVVIPDTTTYLNNSVFKGCEGINELTIPISLDVSKNRDNPAFSGCTNIKKFNFTKGNGNVINYNENFDYYRTPWNYSESNEIQIIIEDGVSGIGSYMFYNKSSIRKLNLPTSLTSIGEKAFEGCYPDLLQVFYKGSSSQWENIDFGGNRVYLSNVLYDQN